MKKISFSLFLFFLCLLCVNLPVWAEETKAEQNTFTLEVANNLINLQADKTSFKEILNALEKKTGIKVKIFDGVDDRKVTLNIKTLPVYAVHTLLEKMELQNFAVVYDNKIDSKAIYILSVGQNIRDIVKDDTNVILLPNQIDVHVAQLVAEEYLPKYYPEEWVYFHTLIFYDLYNQPAAYAFIFRKPDSEITTWQELGSSMKMARSERDKLTEQIRKLEKSVSISPEQLNKLSKLKRIIRIHNKSLYKWNSFATLITGTTEISSLELSHYKGLPPVFVKKVDMQRNLNNEYEDKNLKLEKIIFFDPFDIRYEVLMNFETTYLMDSGTNKLEKISTIKGRIDQAKLRDIRRRNLMKPKEREWYDQGIQNRYRKNISKWEEFKEKL